MPTDIASVLPFNTACISFVLRSMIAPALEKARNCTECKTCVPRCPYHLDIPALLKASVAYWETAQAG
jgi:predicted aldo/keto reductase-like oxidoreductase